MAPRFQNFDWSASTVIHRQMLFVICNEIRKQQHWTWKHLLKVAGITNAAGADYEQNFRRGKISKANAAKFYKWVFELRPYRAGELYAALKEDAKKTAKVLTSAEAYKKDRFGLNYSWDGPKYADDPLPLDDDPDPPPAAPRVRKARKA